MLEEEKESFSLMILPAEAAAAVNQSMGDSCSFRQILHILLHLRESTLYTRETILSACDLPCARASELRIVAMFYGNEINKFALRAIRISVYATREQRFKLFPRGCGLSYRSDIGGPLTYAATAERWREEGISLERASPAEVERAAAPVSDFAEFH